MLTASYLCIPLPSQRTMTDQEWQQTIPLDAPWVIVTGSHESCKPYTDGMDNYPMPACTMRDGY